MNRFDFATSIIKSTPQGKMMDRAFIWPLLFCFAVWAAAIYGKTDFDKAIDFTKWILATFIGAEKLKDAWTAYGALKSGTPDTVNVAGDVNSTTTPTTTPLEPLNSQAATNDFSFGDGEVNEYAG